MKQVFFFLVFIHAIYLAPAQNKKVIKDLEANLTGHWIVISSKDSIMSKDDFINNEQENTLKLIKYKEEKYQWSGAAYTGIKFKKNGEFGFFNNVLCSTETDPKNSQVHGASVKIILLK